jgi:hypothetical protein
MWRKDVETLALIKKADALDNKAWKMKIIR